MSHVTRYCPRCGFERREGERFCRNCGAPLGSGQTDLHPSPELPPSDPPSVDPPPVGAPSPRAQGSPLPAPPVPQAAEPPRATQATSLRPLALGSGVLLAVASVLPWISLDGAPSINALDIPIQALWDLNAADGPIEIGFITVTLGLLGAGLSFVARTAWVRRLCGSITLAIVAIFVLQLFRSIDQAGGSLGDVLGAIGIGVYVAAAAAIGLQVSR